MSALERKGGASALGTNPSAGGSSSSNSKAGKKRSHSQPTRKPDPIECPSDAFGQECSDRGTCNHYSGICTCSSNPPPPKGSAKAASALKKSPFLFLQEDSSESMSTTRRSSAAGPTVIVHKDGTEVLVPGTAFGESCQYTACPIGTKSGPGWQRTCNGQGVCNKMTGECMCYEGWTGASCDVDPNSLAVFDVECDEMDDHYIAECNVPPLLEVAALQAHVDSALKHAWHCEAKLACQGP